MKIIGSLEIVQMPGEEGRRYCIRLDNPNIDDLKEIKFRCKKEDLELGLYNVFDDFNFEKIA